MYDCLLLKCLAIGIGVLSTVLSGTAAFIDMLVAGSSFLSEWIKDRFIYLNHLSGVLLKAADHLEAESCLCRRLAGDELYR